MSNSMIPALKPKGGKINRLKRTLAAGEDFTFQADCRFFYFQEAGYGFEIYIEDGPPLDFNLALGYECEVGEVITNIRIKNTLTVAASFNLVFGRGRLIDQRLNVLENRNGSAASLTPNGTVQSSSTVGSVGVVNIPANPNRKKAYIRINFDNISDTEGVDLTINGLAIIQHVRNAANANLGAVVYFNAGFTIIELENYSGPFELINNTSGDMHFQLTEIIYS